jgi:hypothetical protein
MQKVCKFLAFKMCSLMLWESIIIQNEVELLDLFSSNAQLIII